MSYRIEFLSSAEKEFLRLPKTDRQRIGRKIDALAVDPRPSGSRKLAGHANLWRIRSGDYRIVYSIDDPVEIVLITRVRNRRDVYRGLQ